MCIVNIYSKLRIMTDLLKLRTYYDVIINKLKLHSDFEISKSINNNYTSYANIKGYKIGLHFRKAIENEKLIGFIYLDIIISPHYHKNNYKHNGNDFTPIESIKSIIEILDYLDIEIEQRNELEVINIEFGLNLIIKSDVTEIMKGLFYYKRSIFLTKYDDIETFKISNSTKYKEIKIYAKGLQFIDEPDYNIDVNTLRFEVRTKQSKMIKKLGIIDVCDLLKIRTYKRLFDELVKEWSYVLLINLKFKESHLEPNKRKFIRDCRKIDFWTELIELNHRNTFIINKKKYKNIIESKYCLHTQILKEILAKETSFFDVQIPHLESL